MDFSDVNLFVPTLNPRDGKASRVLTLARREG